MNRHILRNNIYNHPTYNTVTEQTFLTWFDALNSSIDFVVSKDLMSRTITAGLMKFVSTLKTPSI
jgi:hypothetical protein